MGPFGSKYKSLNALYCATLLFRDRVQINLARDFRRGVAQKRLHRANGCAHGIEHRRVAMPQKMPRDTRKPQFLRCGLQVLAQEIPSFQRQSLACGKYQGSCINNGGTDGGENFCRLRSNRNSSRTAFRLGLIEMPVVHRFANTEHASIQIDTSPTKRKQLSNTQSRQHQ